MGSEPAAWPVGRRCSVRVPATSANLGPGFDALGLALGLYDVVEAEVISDGLEVEVTGHGADQVPRGEEHLVVRAVRAAGRSWGLPHVPGLRLQAHNAIPHGRGLGSSAAAAVAGVVLADLLSPASDGGSADGASRDLLAVACRLEGHPDNAAAALLGGLTIAWVDDAGSGGELGEAGSGVGGVRAARLQPHPSIEPVVLVPEHRLETRHARAVLPDVVPHLDAARTAGRAALLVHALTTAPDLLLPATEDWLHQRPRAAAMPETLGLVADLRRDGYAAVVSGAGPSVLVLCVGDPDGGLGERAGQLTRRPPDGWSAMAVGIAYQGTRGGFVRPGSREARTVLD